MIRIDCSLPGSVAIPREVGDGVQVGDIPISRCADSKMEISLFPNQKPACIGHFGGIRHVELDDHFGRPVFVDSHNQFADRRIGVFLVLAKVAVQDCVEFDFRKKESGSVGADVPVFRMHFSIIKAIVHYGGIAGAAHNGLDRDKCIQELAIDIAAIDSLAVAGNAFHKEERCVIRGPLRRGQEFAVDMEDRICCAAERISFVLADPFIVLRYRKRGKAHYNKNCCKGLCHGQT